MAGATAASMDDDYDDHDPALPLHEPIHPLLLHLDLLELVLSRLPLPSSISSSSVCKLWHSLLSPPRSLCRSLSSRLFSPRPWFFFLGLNHFLSAKNQAFGFDPESWRWFRFPSLSLPPYDQGSITGTHGLLYALTGSGICKLGFTTSLIRNSWRETPPLRFSRRSPIVQIIRRSDVRHGMKPKMGDSGSGFLLVVAGGKAMYDQLVVEIYDSDTDSWQICAPLPHRFRLCSTSQWMRSTVYQGKLIVYETDTGLMAYLDILMHQWSNAFILKPQDAFCLYLVSCRSDLFIVGICRNPSRIDLWSVDFATLEVTSVAQMPPELYSLFNEDDDEKNPLILCVGGGDFIYFYSDSWHKDYVACMCDLSGGKILWRKIPHLPAPVNRFDKVVCFSSSVTEDICLK